jgi:putative tryptophan/tyrosine transport system substrate-binding protein
MMRRREFITLLGGAAVAWPPLGHAQPATKLARVGFLSPGSEASHARDPRAQGFYQAMRELGWVEGTTITYERRYAEGHFDRLPDLARELAQFDLAAIATASTPPALAAKAATSTIPIVIMDPGDPMAAGLVTSLARPGGNVTGISSMAPELAAKRLETLKDVAPGASRIGMLYNAAIAPAEVALKEMAEAAARLRIVLRPVPIRATGMPAGAASAPGFDEALQTIATEQVDGLLVFADPLTHLHGVIIVRFMTEHRLPALYAGREFVDAGGLISYGPNYPGMFRRGAYFVDRILRGSKPADLPVEQPTKFELVINLKTAKALGLTIPESFLLRADEVIE